MKEKMSYSHSKEVKTWNYTKHSISYFGEKKLNCPLIFLLLFFLLTERCLHVSSLCLSLICLSRKITVDPGLLLWCKNTIVRFGKTSTQNKLDHPPIKHTTQRNHPTHNTTHHNAGVHMAAFLVLIMFTLNCVYGKVAEKAYSSLPRKLSNIRHKQVSLHR